jgi:hypothetical protein
LPHNSEKKVLRPSGRLACEKEGDVKDDINQVPLARVCKVAALAQPVVHLSFGALKIVFSGVVLAQLSNKAFKPRALKNGLLTVFFFV